MLLVTFACLALYSTVIYRAGCAYRDTRCDSDRTLYAVMVASSVMFILARAVSHTHAAHPNESLWLGFGAFNAMFYLALILRLGRQSQCPTQAKELQP